MENVAKHIFDLLFEHDCVILPNFGGFVANYAPAKYEDSKNIISPPKKHLLFNRNLVNNDGLLVHKVSSFKQISYDEALELVNNFSKKLNNELLTEKRIELKGVGILFLANNQYRFKSSDTNFLKSSFGLPVLNAIPFVQNISNEETIDTTPVIELKSKTENAPHKSKRHWWVAAVLLPIFFYTAWIPLKTNLLTDQSQFHYSDLNPFSFKKVKNYYTNSLIFCEKTSSLIDSDLDKSIVKEEDSDFGVYHIDESDSFVTVQLKKVDKIIAESTHVELASEQPIVESNPYKKQRYFLIGGCFKKKSNAVGFLSSLQDMGYSAIEIDLHNNLHRIAISGYSSRKEAKLARKKILAEKGISSWILKIK